MGKMSPPSSRKSVELSFFVRPRLWLGSEQGSPAVPGTVHPAAPCSIQPNPSLPSVTAFKQAWPLPGRRVESVWLTRQSNFLGIQFDKGRKPHPTRTLLRLSTTPAHPTATILYCRCCCCWPAIVRYKKKDKNDASSPVAHSTEPKPAPIIFPSSFSIDILHRSHVYLQSAAGRSF